MIQSPGGGCKDQFGPCSHACSRPCPWSARTAVPTCASSPSLPWPPRCSGFSTTAANRPSRHASARPAGCPPGTTRPSRPYPTGTPWLNRNPSTSSTSRCSGSRLPSPGRAGDAPLSVLAVIVPPPNPIWHPPKRRLAPRISSCRPPSDRTLPLQSPVVRCYGPLTPAAVRLDFLYPTPIL